jgi:hypothetical protein
LFCTLFVWYEIFKTDTYVGARLFVGNQWPFLKHDLRGSSKFKGSLTYISWVVQLLKKYILRNRACLGRALQVPELF